ncbi:RNA methyltransferase [Winogradskyella sp. DF17]|uniref:RNA methyltransferase n=1 Tax=Winogradskyella pelagia TaxID=2819984 RepID=A0ABS3SZ83_9FLAO|nr:RNA methyltransferase [Winogradskyella sp. DF17]MBO3115805.1 RNA methyltransferase [Winogradskyella sp. DF17]
MLSKNQIKLIRSLSQKKYRQELGLFTVEGVKGINEFLNSNYVLFSLFSTEAIFDAILKDYHELTEAELKKISALKTPNKALAVFRIPEATEPPSEGLIVALDDVRDPGNLGTIIRLCDWYGVDHIICSENTVDCYNSKVVQASMGSLTRVNLHYLPLKSYLESNSLPVFGTYMNGESVYESALPSEGIIVFGNEANGISGEFETIVTQKLTIPQFGKQQKTESLNVANAAAILLSEFRRRVIER